MNHSDIPFGKPVTVRVKGQSKRLSRVTLLPFEGDTSKVRVLTGRRGRPQHLPVDRITEVRVLATA